MPLTNIYCNTLINSATVIYFNYGKDGYFTLSCPEPKVIGDIKEIKEKKIFNKLGKKKPLKKDFLLGYPINLKKINLS